MRKILLAIGIALLASATFAQAPPPATEVASVNLTAQVASISSTQIQGQINPVIYQLGGLYKATCYVITTVAASSSSTLPACNVIYADADTGNTHTFALTSTSTANAVDTFGAPAGSGSTFNPKAGVAISFSTTSYASTGGTAMAYAIHLRLEYVGP